MSEKKKKELERAEKPKEEKIDYKYNERSRKLPYISMGVRFVANVEALNMVETAGNLSRHRTVPIVVFSEGKYSIKWYPALSGETLAHAFQYNLSVLERSNNNQNPKLCYFCNIGEFIKHSALDLYDKIKDKLALPQWEKELISNYEKMSAWEIEDKIISNCIVEDLGGFVVATAASQKQKGISIRRTSAFQFSYAIPTLDAILSGSTTTDVQMQVRMASISQNLANKVNYNNPIQVPFNKEIASTTYSFIFNLDADKVCVNSYTNSQICDDRTKVIRVNLALDALKLVIDGNFGASKSRFNPFIEKEIIVATVTKGDVLFTVSSPAMKLEDFINETIERAIAYTKEFNKLRISIYVWANKGRNITVNGKSIKNYIEELKKNNTQSNLTIEYIESYSHSDLIEKLKAEVKIEAKQ